MGANGPNKQFLKEGRQIAKIWKKGGGLALALVLAIWKMKMKITQNEIPVHTSHNGYP